MSAEAVQVEEPSARPLLTCGHSYTAVQVSASGVPRCSACAELAAIIQDSGPADEDEEEDGDNSEEAEERSDEEDEQPAEEPIEASAEEAQDKGGAQARGGDNAGSASTLRQEAEATPAAPHGAREVPPELPRGEGGLLTDEGAFHAPPLRADSAPDAEAEGEGSAAGDEGVGATSGLALAQPFHSVRASEPGPKGCWALNLPRCQAGGVAAHRGVGDPSPASR